MDLITYALLKKKIEQSSTGVKDVRIEGNPLNDNVMLVFELGDGSEIKVDTPIKEDCVDIEIVSALPTENISETTVYVVKENVTDEDGNEKSIMTQYIRDDNEWLPIGSSNALIEEVNNEDIGAWF